MNYLFVDDDFVETKVLVRHFKKYNHPQLFFANSYKEAITVIENNEIDVIFSDFNLGDGEGFQFHTDYPSKKLYILSGSGLTPTKIKELSTKNIQIIDKDFDKNYLKTINEIMGISDPV